jgi:hypothetical protein
MRRVAIGKFVKPGEIGGLASSKSLALLVLGAAAVLAGCNGPTASVSPQPDTLSSRLGNLLAFNSSSAPAGGSAGTPAQRIDCPTIQIDPGASSFRSASGEGAAGVRYQLAIGDVARDCALVNGALAVRVGVETNVVLGPAGSPGNYTAPLRIAIRKQAGEVIVTSKVYRVGGAVGANGQAQFTLVSDPLTVPYINEHAADDYEVVLGLGENGGAGVPSRRGKH